MIKIDGINYATTIYGASVIGFESDRESIVIPPFIEYEDKKYKVIGITKLSFASIPNCRCITLPDTITNVDDYRFYKREWYLEMMQRFKDIFYVNRLKNFINLSLEDIRCIIKEELERLNLSFDVVNISGTSVEGLCRNQVNSRMLLEMKITAPRKLLLNGECLTSIEVPDTVKYINHYAFYNCIDLENINFGKKVNNISLNAFESCISLKNVVLPMYVSSLGARAFKDCTQLKKIKLSKYLRDIGEEAFSGCKSLLSIKIPKNVNTIGIRVFKGCTSLKSIVVDKNNLLFDSRDNCNAIIRTFSNTLIVACKETIVPSSVTGISDFAFQSSPPRILYIPKGITEKPTIFHFTTFKHSMQSIIVDKDNPIYDSRNDCNAIIESETNTLVCGCQNTIIPNGVEKIANSAFKGCVLLKSINIPDSVTSIGESAFYGCSKELEIIVSENLINKVKFPEGVKIIRQY